MEIQFADHFAAWVDFYAWVTKPEIWADIDRAGRDQIAKAERRRLGLHRSPLTDAGIKSLLTKHAPSRYRFEERVILIEKASA